MFKTVICAALTLFSFPILALEQEPIAGLYGGGNIAASWASSTDILNGSYTVNKLTYSMMGAIGAQLGYRWHNLRLEGELFYNNSPYNSLTTNNTVIGEDTTIYSNSSQTNYITGDTNILATMANIYFDFLDFGIGSLQFTPYVGAGGGYAWIQNNLNVYVEGTKTYTDYFYPNQSRLAGQLMAGILLFLDDSSFFALDYRYFTTTNEHQQYGDVQSSFQNQLMSINLSFNASFNWG